MPIIRSSRVLYCGCYLWYFVMWFSSCCSGAELRVELENHSTKYHRQLPLYSTLELLMMGVVVSEKC